MAREEHVVLQNVVQVDVEAAVVIENRDPSAAVDIGPELRSLGVLGCPHADALDHRRPDGARPFLCGGIVSTATNASMTAMLTAWIETKVIRIGVI